MRRGTIRRITGTMSVIIRPDRGRDMRMRATENRRTSIDRSRLRNSSVHGMKAEQTPITTGEIRSLSLMTTVQCLSGTE